MTHASLTKSGSLPDRPTGQGVYIDGGAPIVPGYTVKGHYADAPRVGFPFSIERYERNGVSAYGIMETSPVAAIKVHDEDITLFTTANSTYVLESLDSKTAPTPPAP